MKLIMQITAIFIAFAGIFAIVFLFDPVINMEIPVGKGFVLLLALLSAALTTIGDYFFNNVNKKPLHAVVFFLSLATLIVFAYSDRKEMNKSMKSCAVGSKNSCYKAAEVYYRRGKLENSLSLHKQMCTNDFLKSCQRGGFISLVNHKKDSAKLFFASPCKKGNWTMCKWGDKVPLLQY